MAFLLNSCHESCKCDPVLCVSVNFELSVCQLTIFFIYFLYGNQLGLKASLYHVTDVPSYHIYKIHIGLGKQTVIIKNCPDLRKALSIYAAKTNSVCIFASGNGTNIDMNNYLDISQLVLS